MWRIKIPTKPKPASQSAGPPPELPPVAMLFTDKNAIFENYQHNFLKDCIAEMATKIKLEDDIGSMYLLGLMHIDGKMAGHHFPASLQDLAYGITLLERVIYKYDPTSKSPLMAEFKSLAQASAFKLYELYAGKLADKSKTDDKKASICLEIATLLGHTEAVTILTTNKPITPHL